MVYLKSYYYKGLQLSIFYFSMYEKQPASISHLQEWLLFLSAVYYGVRERIMAKRTEL